MALRKSHLYDSLWQSCDQLRGGMDASQYKDYVLTLLFMKYVSDKYADIADDPYADIVIPAGGGFADMTALKGKKEIGDGINKVICRLADANGSLLRGVIDQADFNDESRMGRGREMKDRLTKLVGIFEGLDFRANRAHGDDLLGDAYEYLMRHFATQSGKSKGQFYTPAEVSRIMARVIGIGPGTTRDRSVYDPTCGSGSLLIKASDEAPQGLTIFGQEMDVATWTMARMNMILHGHTAAEIERGNTLAAPRFIDKSSGLLQRFDFAVANPPFSTKAWSNGLDPAHDAFRRFGDGIPPANIGDYAFLLHLVASLKSTGRGAIILPHGVLFRGNREEAIRRNLVRRGLIQGVIGLPANLFYGTGIPACIVVLDKQNAAARDGVFMIDASRGFQKDGAKNRLRERDIHRIVDVFNERRVVSGYARTVPMDEIACEANDYNLNIPRYIDSGVPEDLHDLGAHLHGGIPNRDIDALGRFWEVFPGLRERLFAPGGREGYSRAQAPANELRAIVHGHDEFTAYGDRTRRVFGAWRRTHAPRLLGLGEGDSPKTLIRDLSQDLLNRFADLPLLDHYDVYQCLMDYWDKIMQDDAYLVVTEGWTEAAQPRALAGGRGKGATESPDLTVRRRKYKMDLLPPGLVAGRYFAEEQREVEFLLAEQERNRREKEAFVEQNMGEDGLLDGATTDAGKVTQKAVTSRLKGMRGASEDPDERDALEACLDLMKAHAKAKRTWKAAQAKLDEKVLARYGPLGAAEVADMVVGDKWMASIEDAIQAVVERLTGELVDRVRVLEDRYAESLPELERRVRGHGAKVEAHLKRIGLSEQQLLTGRTRLPVFQGDWVTGRLGSLGEISGAGVDKKTRADETPVRLLNYLDVYRKTFIRSRDLTQSVSATDRKVLRCTIACGDVFFTPTSEVANDIGRPALAMEDIVDGVYSYHVVRFRPHVDWDLRFRAFAFDTEAFRAQTSKMAEGSGTRYVITLPKFRSLLVSYPPTIAEQRAIATVLSDMHAEIAALERRLDKTRSIKQGMMQQLLTGAIRLPVPDDELEGESHDA